MNNMNNIKNSDKKEFTKDLLSCFAQDKIKESIFAVRCMLKKYDRVEVTKVILTISSDLTTIMQDITFLTLKKEKIQKNNFVESEVEEYRNSTNNKRDEFLTCIEKMKNFNAGELEKGLDENKLTNIFCNIFSDDDLLAFSLVDFCKDAFVNINYIINLSNSLIKGDTEIVIANILNDMNFKGEKSSKHFDSTSEKGDETIH